MSTVSRSWINRTSWGLPNWYTAVAIVVLASYALTQSLPVLGLLGVLVLPKLQKIDLLSIYVFLMFTIPLSTELYLPMGLATDLPAEQLMWLLTIVGVLQFWWTWPRIPGRVVRHPVTMAVTLIPVWIVITSITSIDSLQSIKYLLAKLWYTISMFYMALYILSDAKALRRAMKWLIIGTSITVIAIMIQHGMQGFSFESINGVLKPFYRNHVDYACMVILVLPFLIWFRQTVDAILWRRWLFATIILFILAVILSYTRAAIIAGFLSPVVFIIIRYRLSGPSFFLAGLITVGSAGYMLRDYRYMDFAPDFNTTIYHKDFGNLLAATADGSDVSTMERYYRWLAGYEMVKERPWLGFGASNFVQVYRGYTNKSFRTWVSDNEEGSGIHNYYLMLLVEQGIPGLLLFVFLNVAAFLRGQRDYHRLRDPIERGLIVAALTSIFIVLLLSFMNDMIEALKVGTVYFLTLAILVRASLLARM